MSNTPTPSGSARPDASPQAGGGAPPSQPSVVDVTGREVPEEIAQFHRKLMAAVMSPEEREWRLKKKRWWLYAKEHPEIIEAYKVVVEDAWMDGTIPLPPSTAYDKVRAQGYEFTRDFSPFFARLMNYEFKQKVFKIAKQVGEPDSVFESLVNP